jgi:hypothetical protein
MESVLLDVAGHRRSPAPMPGYHGGRPPRNKGEEYPADPPTIEEITAVMRTAGDRADGDRLRALIVRQRTTIRAVRRWPWRSWPAWRMTATISSTVGGPAG